MKLTARVEYGCVAILELAARHESDQRVPVREIADRHGIPAAFLVQILLQLKAAGLVESTRGATGGYRLTRPPSEISLWDILSNLEAQETWDLADDLDEPTHDSLSNAVRMAWRQANRQQRSLFQQIKIDHLLEESRKQAEPMYHI